MFGCGRLLSNYRIYSADTHAPKKIFPMPVAWKRSPLINLHSAHLLAAASIMSADINLRRWARCSAKTSSGQWRSWMKDWSASNFHSMSSDVAQPFLYAQVCLNFLQCFNIQISMTFTEDRKEIYRGPYWGYKDI